MQIRNNLLKVHTKFVYEGKATISLNEPEIDICISQVKHQNNFLNKFLYIKFFILGRQRKFTKIPKCSQSCINEQRFRSQ